MAIMTSENFSYKILTTSSLINNTFFSVHKIMADKILMNIIIITCTVSMNNIKIPRQAFLRVVGEEVFALGCKVDKSSLRIIAS